MKAPAAKAPVPSHPHGHGVNGTLASSWVSASDPCYPSKVCARLSRFLASLASRPQWSTRSRQTKNRASLGNGGVWGAAQPPAFGLVGSPRFQDSRDRESRIPRVACSLRRQPSTQLHLRRSTRFGPGIVLRVATGRNGRNGVDLSLAVDQTAGQALPGVQEGPDSMLFGAGVPQLFRSDDPAAMHMI